MTVGLGQECADVPVDPFLVEFHGGVRDRVVPPGDTLLLVQDARNALVECVLKENLIAVERGPIGDDPGIDHDADDERAENADDDRDDRVSL